MTIIKINQKLPIQEMNLIKELKQKNPIGLNGLRTILIIKIQFEFLLLLEVICKIFNKS